MKHFVNSAWPLILPSLALATLGWALKLDDHRHADTCILVGTGLVLLFGAQALWKLVHWLDPGLRGPLATIAAGLLISWMATPSLTAQAALVLALAGSALSAAGTAWLLVRLNRTWDSRPASLRRKYPV